jgi:hypothetical protein
VDESDARLYVVVSIHNTLPMHNDDFGCELRTVGKLVEALAVEHAKVLHAFVPVHVQFVPTAVPSPRLRLT